MTKSKMTAIRLTVEAVAVLLVAVYFVAHYEAQITAINWRLVSIVAAGALLLFAFYRWQMREDNGYNALDMFMKDGRANLEAHLTIASFVLAVWVVVQYALAHEPVTEMMLGVLGFFVAGKAASGFSDAMKSRGAPVDQSQNINVLPNARIEQETAQAAATAAVRKSTTKGKLK